MSRPFTSSLNSAIGVSLVFLLASPAAMAQTWDGDTNANWGVATNWNGNVAPSAGDTVTINNGSLGNQPSISSGDSFTVQQTAITAGSLTIGGSLTSNVTVQNPGTLTIQVGGDLVGNVTNNGTFNNSGSVTGNVSNSGTLHALNGASFHSLSNTGLFDLGGGVTNIVDTLALGAGSSLSIAMADYPSGGPSILAGNAVLGGLLMLDFSGVSFIDDFWTFDLIQVGVGGGLTGDFSGFQVSGLAPDLSFSASQFDTYYSINLERMITTPVPEPEIYAMLGLGLGLMGWVGRRRKLQTAA